MKTYKMSPAETTALTPLRNIIKKYRALAIEVNSLILPISSAYFEAGIDLVVLAVKIAERDAAPGEPASNMRAQQMDFMLNQLAEFYTARLAAWDADPEKLARVEKLAHELFASRIPPARESHE